MGFEDIPAPRRGAEAGGATGHDASSEPAEVTSPPVPGPRLTPTPDAGQAALAPSPDPPPLTVTGPVTVTVAAPLHGELLPLSEVPDPVFARGLMGVGVAIRPTNGVLRSPVEGTITSVARARHAVGITSEEGVDLLLHVGIDTVHLGGRPFETLVTQGQRVQVGTPLILVDLDALLAAGCETATPIVVTNPRGTRRSTWWPEVRSPPASHSCG